MKFLIVGILLVSVALSGCYTMKVYTFQKDKVDQAAEGNRGYIMGTPPPAPTEGETPKRDLIGVDIELGLLPGEKARVDFGVSDVTKVKQMREEMPRVAGEPRRSDSAEMEDFEPAAEPMGYSEEEEEEWVK